MSPNSSLSKYDSPTEVIRSDAVQALTPDLAYKWLTIVNVVPYGRSGVKNEPWALIRNVGGRAHSIVKAAEECIGATPPGAIIIATDISIMQANAIG